MSKNEKMLDVAKLGRALRSYATHHNHGDGWTYTRNLHGIKHIRYDRDWKGYYSLWRRLGRAFDTLAGDRPTSRLFGPTKLRYRPYLAWRALQTEDNRPDGTLNDGIVMTVWEEDGEYIEWVGPTVGEKIADFLEAEPQHPHAIAIAEEMRRVRQLGIDRRKAEKGGDE